ncbi:MAG: hypothetical protein ACFFD6_04455 [Candidatus Thorarchaeota archaeon]
MDTFFQYIFGFFDQLFSTPLQPWIPWGPGDWYFTISTTFFVVVILFLVRRLRKGGSGSVADGVRKIIASTGDVTAGMSGAKKLNFLKDPSDALVYLKIEENALQQALTAAEFYAGKGEIEESIKLKLEAVYQHRLEAVRAAIAKDDQLKSIVATSDEIGKARSDYLRKLAAMSGTTVEAGEDGGPPSVGMPSATPATPTAAATPATGPPSGGAPSGGPPSGGAPSGGPPSGGPPAGGPPSGGPPSGGAPAGGPPGGAVPAGGPPGGAAPAAGPPGGATPSGGPPGGAVPGGAPAGGPPGGAAPSGAPPGADAPAAGGKSSLQSEMLREMERLKALMGGD